MYLIVLLAVFVVIAIVSVLGLTADTRDVRPHRPLQSPGMDSDAPWPERLTNTALPPYRQARVRAH
jgi:hypothetical protein